MCCSCKLHVFAGSHGVTPMFRTTPFRLKSSCSTFCKKVSFGTLLGCLLTRCGKGRPHLSSQCCFSLKEAACDTQQQQDDAARGSHASHILYWAVLLAERSLLNLFFGTVFDTVWKCGTQVQSTLTLKSVSARSSTRNSWSCGRP